jgi:hypothetical protein
MRAFPELDFLFGAFNLGSSNRKAAVAYLAACGATAITIIVRDGVCSVSDVPRPPSG